MKRRATDSFASLHPKVNEYLGCSTNFLQFHISDGLPDGFIPYGMQHLLDRKVYSVSYSLIHNEVMRTGGLPVMVFGQTTGELLYHGTDGGE